MQPEDFLLTIAIPSGQPLDILPAKIVPIWKPLLYKEEKDVKQQ